MPFGNIIFNTFLVNLIYKFEINLFEDDKN